MKKRSKLAIAIPSGCLLLVLAYQIASICLANSVDYTPRNWLEYHLLAPEEIKQAPFITAHTRIHFRNGDGNSPQIDEVEITGTDDIREIARYLLKQNYHQADDPVFGKIWLSADGKRRALITRQDHVIRLSFAG